MKTILLLLLAAYPILATSQDVYKTPSGEKYHLATCHMVKNVSKKLLNDQEISQYALTPCKICKPPVRSAIQNNLTTRNKAVGESNSVQCKGITKDGIRCKRKTTMANGFCFQHHE